MTAPTRADIVLREIEPAVRKHVPAEGEAPDCLTIVVRLHGKTGTPRRIEVKSEYGRDVEPPRGYQATTNGGR